MARSFEELRNRMSPERHARSKRLADQMMADIVLAQIQQQGDLTDADMPDIVGDRQSEGSTMDRDDGLRISTLRRLIRSLGGELELVAPMPHGRITLHPGDARPVDQQD